MASAATITAPKVNLKLSSNDAAVLQALFDNGEGAFPVPASSSTTSSADQTAVDPQAINIDESFPLFPRFYVGETALKSLKDRELSIIRRIQGSTATSSTHYTQKGASASASATSGLRQAIDDLSSLIEEQPDYPPLYANRAQALRLLIQSNTSSSEDSDKDAAIFHPENRDLATKLLSDLSKAISLASPISGRNDGKNTTVSPAQYSLLSNTHTHRGYILLKAAKIRKEEEEEEQNKGSDSTMKTERGGPEQLLSIESRDQLEDMASHDFFQAGRYGNDVAKQLSVQTNPYAKMCGAIVKEALKKEIEEFQS